MLLKQTSQHPPLYARHNFSALAHHAAKYIDDLRPEGININLPDPKSHSILPLYGDMAPIVANNLSHVTPETNLQLITLKQTQFQIPYYTKFMPPTSPVSTHPPTNYQLYFTNIHQPSPY